MDRRQVIAALGVAVALPARAQTSRPRRVGIVRIGPRPRPDDIQLVGLPTALRGLGHVEGVTLVIDARYAEGGIDQLPETISGLLRDGADMLVTVGSTPTLAARRATSTTPIVMFANVDPVALGVADQLGRPTGNVTGVLIAPEGSLAAKRLSLLREAVPLARRMALLAPDGDPSFSLQIRETEAAASAAGVELAVVGDRNGDYASAFASMETGGAQALIVGAHNFFVRDRRAIIALAERHRLPAIYEWSDHVAGGGLMSFGASLTERYQRLAFYVDRILKGARAGDLPFEQPAALRLSVNLATARSIGLVLPPSFLAQADEVIE